LDFRWRERLGRGTRGGAAHLRGHDAGSSGLALHNRLEPEAAAKLHEIAGKVINAEQKEIARLKAELAKTRMGRSILNGAAS
jgi:uncharacterized small protein (DUF1192 family)